MDALINSLPYNSTNKEHKIYIIYEVSNEEENVCTTIQVASIKAKEWIVLGSLWNEYAGSDPSNIYSTLFNESGSKSIFDISGKKMLEPHKGINIIDGKKFLVK